MTLRSVALLLGLAIAVPSAARAQIVLTPGQLYSSNYSSRTITSYTPAGLPNGSMTVPASFGSEVKGITFGPDGKLYATVTSPGGFNVISIDAAGTIGVPFTGTEYVAGNLSFGKLNFGNNGQLFVGGQDHLVRFTLGGPSTGNVIYTNNQIYDVKKLSSGNLLVLSAYEIKEITPSGTVVRTINSSIGLGDARGIEYDPAANDIFVTMLGYTGQNFRLMRLDATTGLVEANQYYWYGDDLTLTVDGRLLVGSRTQNPGIFDLNLNQLGTMNGGQQMFVTQMAVPEPGSVALVSIAIAAVAKLRRGNKKS